MVWGAQSLPAGGRRSYALWSETVRRGSWEGGRDWLGGWGFPFRLEGSI